MKVIDIVAGKAIEFRNKTMRVVAMPRESNLLVAAMKAKLETMGFYARSQKVAMESSALGFTDDLNSFYDEDFFKAVSSFQMTHMDGKNLPLGYLEESTFLMISKVHEAYILTHDLSDDKTKELFDNDFATIVNYKIGIVGDAIKNLQSYLNTLGFYEGNINGIFDLVTQNSVIAFQESKGNTPTGIVNESLLSIIIRDYNYVTSSGV